MRLSIECDGETIDTTWGEWLAAHRSDRDACRAVWRVVTRDQDATMVRDGSRIVTVRLAKCEVSRTA